VEPADNYTDDPPPAEEHFVEEQSMSLDNFPTALRRVYSGANFGKQLVQL